MGELEDRINQVLNDPAQMEELSRLAQSLMGEGGGDGGAQQAPPEPGFDAGMLAKAAKLLQADDGGMGNGQGMLRAMEPWLSPRRREKLERAMKLARLSHLARLAFGEEKGDV